jgi:hypothetical protein
MCLVQGHFDHAFNCKYRQLKKIDPLHPIMKEFVLDGIIRCCPSTIISMRAAEFAENKWPSTTHVEGLRVIVLPKDISNSKNRYLSQSLALKTRKQPTENLYSLLGDMTSPLRDCVAYWRPRAAPELGTVEHDSARFAAVLVSRDQALLALKHAHDSIIFLDGTFGISKQHVLLFVLMCLGPCGKGIPIGFILFSPLHSAKLYSSSYNNRILFELLSKYKAYISSFSKEQGFVFTPKVSSHCIIDVLCR